MGFKLNPITGLLDLVSPPAGAPTWAPTVDTADDLPTVGNVDGDVRVTKDTSQVWVWRAATSRWILDSIDEAPAIGSTPSAAGYDVTEVDVSTNRTERHVVLQPADATHPGIITIGAQSLAGDKTFTDDIVIQGDLTVQGTTTTIDTTNLIVEDKNITINHGGSTASAAGAGLDIEGDASAIVGYLRVASDNSNFEFKAPGNASVLTVDINATETITVAGSLNIEADSFINQDLTTDASPTFAAITAAGGSLTSIDTFSLDDTDSAFDLEIESTSTLTANHILTLDVNDADRTLTIASNATISGSNSGDVTLAAIGASPNANGASLSGQVLNLEPASASFGGVVTTGTQSFAGDKTFNNELRVNGELIVEGGSIDRETVGTLTIGGVNTDVINIGNSAATVNIIGDVNIENVTNLDVESKLITVNVGGGAGSGSNSGLQVEEDALITGYATTSGDRNSWTLKAPNTAGIATITPGAGGITLNQSSHDPVTVSDTATIDLTLVGQLLSADVIEAGLDLNNIGGTLGVTKGGTGVTTTPTNGQLLIGNGTGYTVANLTAGTNISITNGSGSITIASGSTGDISQTSFSAANNQSSPADITGFLFNNASVRSFKAQVSVALDATSDLFEIFDLMGIQKSASWSMSQVSTGDDSGVDFTITALGQVQYTSANSAGFVSNTVKFRAWVTTV